MRLPISLILTGLIFSCLGLTACNRSSFIYRMDVQQGNAFSPEMIAALQRGMTKSQVQTMMGTPALSSCLNTNRWDYYYSFRCGKTGKRLERHVTIYFKNDRVVNWQ